jgi:hypothetical protein
MKKTFTLLFLLSSTLVSIAQSHIQWTTPEITPGMQVNILKATNTDKSGNTYTIHFTQESVNHYMTYRFFGYDSDGHKLWQYDNDSCFTNCQDIYSIVVPVDNNGAIFIGSYDDLSGLTQIRIKYIDLNGNLIWQNYWDIPYLSGTPVTARLDHAGNLVVAIKAIVTMPNDNDFAFAKFNTSNGNLMWHFELPDQGAISGWHQEDIRSMDIDATNAIYGCGLGGFDNYFFKVSSNGTLDYEFIIHDNDSINNLLNTTGVQQLKLGTSDDLYLLIGAGQNTWVQKYKTSTGNFAFTKTIQHDSATTSPVKLVVEDNQIYSLSNYFYSFPDTTFAGIHFTNNDYMISKLDTNGNVEWEKSCFLENLDTTFTFNTASGATDMLSCGTNLYVMSNYITDSATGSQSLALHKINLAGNSVWLDTSAWAGDGGMASDSSCNIYISRPAFILGGVHVVTQKYSDHIQAVSQMNNDSEWTLFPNPAHDLIQISSSLKNNFEIQVINTAGKIMISKKNQPELDVSLLAQGIYFLRLQGVNQVMVRKFFKD